MAQDEVKALLLEYNRIVRECDELYRTAAKRLGLPDGAFWILYALREGERALTQSVLCSMLYLPKQTINSSLKKLEADGYLQLQEMKDRRSKRVCLTEKGRLLAEDTVDKVLRAECAALSELPPDERRQLVGLFGRFQERLRERFSDGSVKRA